MLRDTLTALALGVTGALGAHLLGAPAPFLTGPALTVSVAGVAGLRCVIPTPLRHACFLLIGLGLGTGVTPAVLASAVNWPVSLAGMIATVLAIMVLGAAVLRRGFGCDPRTATLSAAPGHLSFVLGLTMETGGDLAFISVLQSLRVLMLTLLVPAFIAVTVGGEMGLPPALGPILSPPHLAALAALAAGLGLALLRLRVPAAFLLAGMAVSIAGHATGLTPGEMPRPLALAAFVTMGTLIGTRFSGVTPAQIRRAALGSVVLTAGGFVIVLAASFAITRLVDLPLADVIIALAPGGLETMIAMSAVIGADPAFVGFHHIARLVFLSFAIPVALARLSAWRAD